MHFKKRMLALLTGTLVAAGLVGVSPATAADKAPAPAPVSASDVVLHLTPPPLPSKTDQKSSSGVSVRDFKVPPGGRKVSSASTASLSSVYYFYAGVSQTVAAAETSVVANQNITSPNLAAGDWHTLTEIAVQSLDGQQVIEIGVTKDPTTFGDNNPHLFVYHWINGVPICYSKVGNLCGFNLYSGRVKDPGASLATDVGSEKPFGIVHSGGAWWLSYDNSYLGNFNDSLWGGTFTSWRIFKGFAEVAAANTTPCTDAVLGALVTPTTGGRVAGSTTYSSGTAGVNLGLFTPTNAAWYNAALASARTARSGGAGAC